MASAKEFHWADYLIFALTLVISTAIGIFFAWKDRNKQNTGEFLLGGRSMGILPVSLSLMATLLSAVMVLGVPAEVYYNGSIYWLILFSNFITYPLAAHAFLPVFHDLGLTSAYEYLELRFNKLVRVVGCFLFIIGMILSMAMGLYAPALALNQVMKFDMLLSILVIGAVCTFYTAIGGLKAVMWTDSFQMIIIIAGFLAVAIQGTTEVGGFDVVWERALNGKKLNLNNFDLNPLTRHTFWGLIIGGSITSLTAYGGNQAMIQRYLSMENTKKAKIALYLQLPAGVIVTSMFVYGGLVLYAKYSLDDPLMSCKIRQPDQLIPWMTMDVLGDFYGFPGLLLACIFSASLSTVSSGINAIALVIMMDMVEPVYESVKGVKMTERASTIISKIMAFGSGGLTIGLAYLAEYFGKLILQVGLSIFGVLGGPLLGVFVCAMFIPTVNSIGAMTGMIASLILCFWLAIGSIVMANANAPPNPCDAPQSANITNITTVTMMSTTTATVMQTQVKSLIAVIVTVIVAVITSCLTGGTKDRPVPRNFLSPLYHQMQSFGRIKDEKNTYEEPIQKNKVSPISDMKNGHIILKNGDLKTGDLSVNDTSYNPYSDISSDMMDNLHLTTTKF
ncbi:hypothetical protein ACJMK2_009877 [Sinanodonta woodiana]|uniref:Sodium-coupled monocarboxylate transporter 1 n=1 Tax=Sinanodonta woodiana TaxID=1069815 RepID=A0ABD3VDL3_SINWO